MTLLLKIHMERTKKCIDGAAVSHIQQFNIFYAKEVCRQCSGIKRTMVNANHFFHLLDQATALTTLDQISWTCTNYNPIAYRSYGGEKAENDCLMQLFNVEGKLPDGEALHFEVADYAMLGTGKGDLVVACLDEGDGCAVSLSSFEEYDSCSPAELFDRFRMTPIVRFADCVLSAAVTDEQRSQLMREYTLYMPEQFMKAEHLRDPMVRLALHLGEDGRILDFHRAALDIDARSTLMDFYGIR